MQIDGAAGKITARVYTPKGDGPFPVNVYSHGGGWMIDTYDSSCRTLCHAAGCVVVSVEYRKAPKSPFPAAADAAFAAYRWALKTASEWKGDPKRVAVAAESAGGRSREDTPPSRANVFQLATRALSGNP